MDSSSLEAPTKATNTEITTKDRITVEVLMTEEIREVLSITATRGITTKREAEEVDTVVATTTITTIRISTEEETTTILEISTEEETTTKDKEDMLVALTAEIWATEEVLTNLTTKTRAATKTTTKERRAPIIVSSSSLLDCRDLPTTAETLVDGVVLSRTTGEETGSKSLRRLVLE
jgi:hypothetical protein